MGPLLTLNHLKKHFSIKKSFFSPRILIQAVDGVSFDIYRGETLGLIGESGSGKSTLINMIMQLIHQDSGYVTFDGRSLDSYSLQEQKKLHKELQVVFQHTFGALDPLKTVETLIKEPLKLHGIVPSENIEGEVKILLERVGLSEQVLHKYPNQISGGQKQRVGIARAIATRPKLLICDEPVSALDVSVQGQILNLLSDLKEEMGMTYLFVSHDLKVIRHIADRIAVMHQGKVIELGSVDSVISNPKEAYTKKLLATL